MKTVRKGLKKRLEPRFVRTALKMRFERNKIFILLRSFLSRLRLDARPSPAFFRLFGVKYALCSNTVTVRRFCGTS